jgi:two-component system cell cycle sensor histidine kinase/response regulator CckA
VIEFLTEFFRSVGDSVGKLGAYKISVVVMLLSVAVTCVFCVMNHRLRKKNKNIEYYLDIIKTVSKTICKTHEIAAFNSNGDILYTTHPFLYGDMNEFLKFITGRSIASHDLQYFQNMMNRMTPGTALLSGSGSGLTNSQKKWMVVCNILDRDESPSSDQLYVVVVSEITKYMEQNERLLKSNEKLENFLDKCPIGIFYTNSSGIITGLNGTFSSMLMLSRERIMGLATTEFIEDFNPNIVDQRPQQIIVKSKFSTNFKAILIKSNISSSSFGQPWFICKIEQQRTKTPLKPDNSEFLEQEVFLSTPVPSVITTISGEIIAVNPAFATIIQDKVVIDRKKVMQPGHNIIDFVREQANRDSLANYLRQSYSLAEKAAPIEIKFAGDNVIAMAYINKLNSGNDERKLLLIQLVDISGQKKLEQQFNQSQKMQAIGQLAGGIAHDFNNLLTAMLGFCDLLLQRHMPNDPSYGDVVQIKQNASRAANLVRQLLAFSRQQTMKPRIISITENIAELSSLIKRLIGVNIDFQIGHEKNIWPVRVDNSQLEQVLINLVINARDAMERTKNAKLIIRTKNFTAKESFKCIYDHAHPGDYVLIEVSDNGSGIDPDIIESIFEPFFTKKGPKLGTGFGLSTVYGIVNQTGGFINVESEIGRGSTFKIYLPRYEGPEKISTQNNETTIAKDLSGSETILIVEDEDAVRMFTARALREKGYKVLEANCGEEAVKIVSRGEAFDLLITDVIMPHMDGPTLNKKLREIIPDLKTIFISGYTEDTFRKDLDKDSDIHFLQKPFTLKDLASKVREVL